MQVRKIGVPGTLLATKLGGLNIVDFVIAGSCNFGRTFYTFTLSTGDRGVNSGWWDEFNLLNTSSVVLARPEMKTRHG